MIICSRCKTENKDDVKFCRECGNDLTVNVDAPANKDLKNLADLLNEKAVHTEKQPFNLNKAISNVPKKLWSGIKNSVFFKGKKNTIITVLSVLTILLLLVCSICFVKILKYSNESKPNIEFEFSQQNKTKSSDEKYSNEDEKEISEINVNFDYSKSVQVIKEYNWMYDDEEYVCLVLKNNSDVTLRPRVQISFLNENGDIIGAEDKDDYGFGPGNEMAFVFSNDTKFESYDYVISASSDNMYNECVSKLTQKTYLTSEKAVVKVTNTGKDIAHYVEYVVLFKNSGQVVDYEWGYCIDADSEIKPGKVEMIEATVGYEVTFDSVEVYLSGRSDK